MSRIRLAHWLAMVAVPFVVIMAFAQVASAQTPAPAPELPPGLNVTDVLNAVAAHQWLALVLLVAVYLRKLLSDASAFPWTIPTNWRSVIVGAAGLVIAIASSLQTGASVQTAIIVGVTGGALTTFLDGLLVAIFGSPSAAPSWAKFILAIIEDVTPGGGSGGASLGGGPKNAVLGGVSQIIPPHASKRMSLARMFVPAATACAGLGLGTIASTEVACTPAQAANVQSTLSQLLSYAQTFVTVAQTVWAIVSGLLPATAQRAASQAFQDALVTVEGAIAETQDALAIASNPANAATLLSNLQAAVATLVQVIDQYTTPTGAAVPLLKTTAQANLVAEMQHEAVVIAGWKL